MKTIKTYEQFVNESNSDDIDKAVNQIRKFNNDELKWSGLIDNILSILGYQKYASIVGDAVSDYLKSSKSDGKVPENEDVISELYNIIKSRI